MLFASSLTILGSLVAISLASPAGFDNLSGGPQPCAADYFVKSLPGMPEGPLIKMHAGHIEVDAENNGNLFFWHFQNKHIAQRQRTVVWLNGGPGCSSMDGALMEVGPYRLKDEDTLVYNEGSWNEFANMLFVDQPVGTGFSYVNSDHYLHDLDEMANHFIIFLTKFLAMFPEYEADDLYFAGESYAGQHIPYIADAILKRNEKPENMLNPWNLKGLLIGNGWIDPKPQYLSYTQFAYKYGLLDKGSSTAAGIEKQLAVCVKDLDAGGDQHVDTNSCEEVLQQILSETTTIKDDRRMCINMYDIRLRDAYPACGMNWPPDLTSVTPYLRKNSVVEALHISGKKSGWTECAGSVSSTFRARKSAPAITLLPNILTKMPVLLFSGQSDFICNHIGTEESIHGMQFNGGTGFELSPGVWAPREDWVFEGKPAGIYQSARNLTYVQFYNASHMVPFDVPRASRQMLDRFMGVDINSIGGPPVDSTVGDSKDPLTAIGSHPNSTAAEEEHNQKLRAARWGAYYRSGEIALVLVASAAVIWGFVIWRARKGEERRGKAGYGVVRDREMELEEGGREWSERAVDDMDAATHSLGGESDDESSGDEAVSGGGGRHHEKRTGL